MDKLRGLLHWKTRPVKWPVWTFLTLLTVAFYYSAIQTVPDFPYYYNGDVIYPWMIFVRSGFYCFGLPILGFLSFLGLQYSLQFQKNRWVKAVVTFFTFLAAAIFCFLSGFAQLITPSLSYQSSIVFNDHVYHLAFSYGGDDEFEATMAVYIVYQCDQHGIVCHLYYCPLYQGLVGATYMEYAKTLVSFFTIEQNQLYVQVGPDKTLVHPECQYGSGYSPEN